MKKVDDEPGFAYLLRFLLREKQNIIYVIIIVISGIRAVSAGWLQGKRASDLAMSYER